MRVLRAGLGLRQLPQERLLPRGPTPLLRKDEPVRREPEGVQIGGRRGAGAGRGGTAGGHAVACLRLFARRCDKRSDQWKGRN